MIIAIGLLLAAFTILTWYRQEWGVLFIIAALPSYLIRFNLVGIPFTFLEGLILAATAIWIIKDFLPANREFFKRGFRRQPGRISYPYSWEMVAVLIISLVSVGVSYFQTGALGIWKAYFFEPILLYILILNTLKNTAGIKKIIAALTISAAAVSIFAAYQEITGQFITNPFWSAAATRRVVSFFGYPNAVGLYLAPLSLLILPWIFSTKISPRYRLIILITVSISWLAILFAQSEGAMVAVAAGVVTLGLMANRKSRLVSAVLITLITAGVFLLRPLSDPIIQKASLHDLSGEIRRQQWTETVIMLNDGRLLSGAGLDNYQRAITPYHQDGIFYNFDNRPNFDAVVWASSTLQKIYWQPVEIYLYPHNIFLNFWSELGIAGLLLFVWIIIKASYLALQTHRSSGKSDDSRFLSLGILGALSTIVVQGLVDVPYFKNDLAAMFWIILALGAIANLMVKPDKSLS